MAAKSVTKGRVTPHIDQLLGISLGRLELIALPVNRAMMRATDCGPDGPWDTDDPDDDDDTDAEGAVIPGRG